MIDLHTHILPGIDDGAKSLQESVAMARIAYADGVRVMAATPHNHGYVDPGLRTRVCELTAEVQDALNTYGVNVRVVPGVEAFLVPDLVKQLDEGSALPLDTSRYVLVEWGFSSTPLYTEQVLFELQVHGFTPIIAHPARYHAVQDNPNLLHGLVARGVLCQLTAASLTGDWGSQAQETAITLLEHNMAHIIASDAHSPDWRPPLLSKAVEEASRIMGEERAWAMVTTVPQDILEDREVTVEPPGTVKPRRRWFWG